MACTQTASLPVGQHQPWLFLRLATPLVGADCVAELLLLRGPIVTTPQLNRIELGTKVMHNQGAGELILRVGFAFCSSWQQPNKMELADGGEDCRRIFERGQLSRSIE
jgi:hypothetical protein